MIPILMCAPKPESTNLQHDESEELDADTTKGADEHGHHVGT